MPTNTNYSPNGSETEKCGANRKRRPLKSVCCSSKANVLHFGLHCTFHCLERKSQVFGERLASFMQTTDGSNNLLIHKVFSALCDWFHVADAWAVLATHTTLLTYGNLDTEHFPNNFQYKYRWIHAQRPLNIHVISYNLTRQVFELIHIMTSSTLK